MSYTYTVTRLTFRVFTISLIELEFMLVFQEKFISTPTFSKTKAAKDILDSLTVIRLTSE